MAFERFLLLCTFALVAATQISAHSEAENFAYINRIIENLNDKKECKVPTFDEVDELQKSFEELEQTLGTKLESKLNDDQRLIRENLLSDWTSFQQRMTSGVVIRSAKKRAFMCKIEAYQNAKFGSSVCTLYKNTAITDRIFEKNAIVRYVEHIQDGTVIDQNSHPRPAGIDPNAKIIYDSPVVQVFIVHTPIEGVTPVGTKPPVDEKAADADAESGDLDPLADLPVPPAHSEPEEVTDEQSSPIPAPVPEPIPAPIPAPIPEQTVTTTPAPIEPAAEETKVDEPTEPEVSPAADTISDSQGYSDAEAQGQSISGDADASTDGQSGGADGEASEDNQSSGADRSKDAPGGSDVTDETNENSDIPHQDENDEQPVETPREEVTARRPIVEFDEFGAELIDLADDNQDLDRLDRVAPNRWDLDVTIGRYSWPDESKGVVKQYGDIVRERWTDFIARESHPEEDEEDPEPVEIRKPARNIRQRKKEILAEAARSNRKHDLEIRHGWINQWGDSPNSSPQDSWMDLADNNFIKIAVNKNYVKNSPAAQAAKALKKRIMSG